MRLGGILALCAALLSGPALAQDGSSGDGPRQIPTENVLVLELETGTVFVEMFPDIAPRHVERVRTLATQGFYDGVVFHRVIPGFMAQGGDPTGTGRGSSDLPDLRAEFSDIPHRRGIASMARSSDPDSANSQFFIMLADSPDDRENWDQLDGTYTIWGRVIEGMDNVDAVAVGEPPEEPTQIVTARVLITEQPDLEFIDGPPDLPQRIERAEMVAEAFDPLFEDDVDIDILSPVLAN